ncbi:hypothetical protein [Sphingobacterium sp. MYb382]|uniref:hypothetical protein n=1 Tax=Sphingobacterium sp. MYb382 TaxID=2745278 RepID=UPI0030B30118
MGIFKNYTGNAMFNNALMTIESLGKLKSVEDITDDFLRKLYKDTDLLNLNKRLKSYTMLFTNNGLLHNSKSKDEQLYNDLMNEIIDSNDFEGDNICEISGLRFSKTFSQIYTDLLIRKGISEKEVSKKDTGINRNWYPLIGGLGSDAQALPQGKFAIQIHPICVFIMQFLPLSAFIYNRGILVVDSSNTMMAKRIIVDNQTELWKRIKATTSNESIENVKDFSKGHYILQAIKFLEEKELFDESYSDLNLWSFSNSGTGASCDIDRVPNSLIRKLIAIDKDSGLGNELKNILINTNLQYGFLEALEGNHEWHFLYPSVSGSGKKEIRYSGVSVKFLEVYFEQINNEKSIHYAKYIAGLIDLYKSKSFEKYLSEVSAWNRPEYRIDLYTVLLEATKNGQWSLKHHLQILDDRAGLPIKNNYYKLQKLIHYYYQKQHFSSDLPAIKNGDSSEVEKALTWIIGLVQEDQKSVMIIEKLKNRHKYKTVGYSDMLIRSVAFCSIKLEDIATVFYTDVLKLSHYGINELLHILYNQPELEIIISQELALSVANPSVGFLQGWFDTIEKFAIDYQAYYYAKYQHRDTKKEPIEKFKKLISSISLGTGSFMFWLREAIDNTNQFLANEKDVFNDRWTDEQLLYSPYGDLPYSFSKLAIKLILTQQAAREIIQNQIN